MSDKVKISYHKYLLISSTLLLLFPAALISGPFLPDLFLTLISIIFLVTHKLDDTFRLFKNYLIIFAVFWIYIVIGSLFSDSVTLSIKSTLPYFRFGLFSLAIYFIFKNRKQSIKYFYISLIATLIVLLIDGYYQFFSGSNIFGYKTARPDRLGGLFFDELILGSFISKILPIFITLSVINEKIISKKYIFIFIFSSYLLIFLSGERAAFISISFYLLLISPFILNRKRFFLFSFMVLIVFCSLVLSNKTLKSRWVDQMLMHIIHKEKNAKIFMPDHIGLFTSAIDIFEKNIIFGSGVKTFRVNCKYTNPEKIKELKKIIGPVYYCSTHPHNYYLQLLAETGLIGFTFVFLTFCKLLAMYISQLYFLIKKEKKLGSKSYVCILSGLVVSLWPLITSGNFFNNWISSILYLTIGLFLFVKSNEVKNYL